MLNSNIKKYYRQNTLDNTENNFSKKYYINEERYRIINFNYSIAFSQFTVNKKHMKW